MILEVSALPPFANGALCKRPLLDSKKDPTPQSTTEVIPQMLLPDEKGFSKTPTSLSLSKTREVLVCGISNPSCNCLDPPASKSLLDLPLPASSSTAPGSFPGDPAPSAGSARRTEGSSVPTANITHYLSPKANNHRHCVNIKILSWAENVDSLALYG